jgi:hypothetical protein
MIERQRRCFGTLPPVSTLVMGGRRRRRGVGRFCWQQPDREEGRAVVSIKWLRHE